MIKSSFIFLLLLVIAFSASGQHLIGFPASTMDELVKKEFKGFNRDNSSKNESFNYLKYVNSSGTKTLIVFISEDSLSIRTRMVCDYSEFDLIKEDYDNKYKKVSASVWEYSIGNKNYVITLEEKEWYFTLSTKEK